MKISQNRKEIIDEVLKDLELLKNRPDFNQYAIDENIAFFEATKSIPKYIRWLITKVAKIDSERLLEINDLLPKYDLMMHKKLIEMEKRKFPGLIAPLVDRISEIVSSASKSMTLINIGCGGMEAERQIINNLIINKYNNRLVFIGVDRSPIAAQLIAENLASLTDKIEFYELGNLDNQKLQEMAKNQKKQFLVLLCKNNIFELDKYFSENVFDIAFHVLFKHHLNQEEKIDLDNILNKISKNIVEYDGYLSWHNIIPQTIIGWNNPIFLNAEIFSHLKFLTKRWLMADNLNRKISFYKIGYYLLEYKQL